MLHVDNITVRAKLDTGALVNVLSEREFSRLEHRPKLEKATEILKGFNNNIIPTKGRCWLRIQHKTSQKEMLFYIVPGDVQTLLGRQACEDLKLIKRLDSIHTLETYDELAAEFEDVFRGLGCIEGDHQIKLDESVQPVVQACRKVPFALMEKLRMELERMVKLQVIVKVTEPTDWVDAIVITSKKNGDIRVCLDPRHLNKTIKRQHYKLPTREEILAQFSGARYFSELDASSGFWQLQLDEQSSKYCTFITPFERYRYLRLPFGISSAPELYHRVVHEMFEGIANIDTSMDDIIVWGKTRDEHDVALRRVLEKARMNNLKLNKDKCQFGVTEVTFLGDRLTQNGVQPDVEKVIAIQEMPQPSSVKELQRFLGMVTYLARWIPDLSSVAAPLRILLNKNIQWMWDVQQEQAWLKLKNMLMDRPVLQFYDVNRQTKISSDANKDGLGACRLTRALSLQNSNMLSLHPF